MAGGAMAAFKREISPRMKIQIADKLAPEGAKYLESLLGVAVTAQTGLAGSQLTEARRDHQGVVKR